MTIHATSPHKTGWPTPGAVLQLLKPVTWFPPMWAYGCGAISVSGGFGSGDFGDRWPYVLAGIVLAGPLLCGTSQAVNDWFDRHVDAINEPHRVIPSGRMPGRWGLGIAIGNSVLSLMVAMALGPWVFAAAFVGLVLAWAYSAPPARLKANGWFGNLAVGLSYETLPWITAAVAMSGAAPSGVTLLVALLYGLGAHGIMTLNDFKSVKGDTIMGLASLPVQLGVARAARLAAGVMIAAQIGVIIVLAAQSILWAAGLILVLVLLQIAAMRTLLADPEGKAVWYSAVGVGLYVLGMLVTAFALRGIAAAGILGG